MRLLLLFALALPLCAQDISIYAEFRTLWWSPGQMSGLNPDNPPPKTTEVVIDRWEYTDPVGVPHPDDITAHVAVRNKQAKPSVPIVVSVSVRWKEGPARAKKRAVWSLPKLLKTFPAEAVPASGEKLYTIPINLSKRMKSLEKRGRWPHEMELIVTARSAGHTLARYTRPFPIGRGD